MTSEPHKLHFGKALACVVLVAVVLGFVLGLAFEAIGVPDDWRSALSGGVLGGVSVWLIAMMKRAVVQGGAPWLRA